jgi:hypothetical protein
MEPARNVGQLNAADWKYVQDVVTRFETAWCDGNLLDLEAFLPPRGLPLRLLVLKELIKSDLELRWRNGKVATLEDYLNRFPELLAQPSRWADLLYEEFRVRHAFGDKPPLAAYRQRFPEQFPELERLLTQGAGAAFAPKDPRER